MGEENKANNKSKIKEKRILLCILFNLGILLIGLIYYLLIQWGIGLVCPFKTFFHIDCPYCGLSRYCIAMLQLRFVDAFNYHPIVFISVPILAYLYFKVCLRYIKTGIIITTEKENEFITLFLLISLVFGIFRVLFNGSVGSVF